MPKNLQDYLCSKVFSSEKVTDCCENLNMQWKMLDWDSRGYHQQLNCRWRITPNH